MRRFTPGGFRVSLNPLSTNLLISYLSILLFPLLAIVIVYMTASNLLVSIQKEKMYNSLQLSAADIGQTIQEAGNLGNYISNSQELERLCNTPAGAMPVYYDVYLYTRSLKEYTLFNEAIDGVYLFFREGDYIIKDSVVLPANEEAYGVLGPLGGDSLEGLRERLGQRYYNREVLRDDREVQGKIVVLQSFPGRLYNQPKGTLAVVLKEESMEEHLRANLLQNQGAVFLIGKRGDNIWLQKEILGENESLRGEDIPFREFVDKKNGIYELQGKKYIACLVRDEKNSYLYLSVIPRKVLLGQIGYIKYVIILLSVCSVMMGLGLCLAMWRKRRQVVLAFSRYQEEFGIARQGDKKVQGFWEGIPWLLDSAMHLQTALRLQRGVVRTAILRKALLGEYDEEAALDKDMRQAELTLEGDGYCVAVLMLPGTFHLNKEHQEREIRLSLKEYAETRFQLPCIYCEMDVRHAALVCPVGGEDRAADLLRELTLLQELLLEELRLETYIGVGNVVDERLEIATSYDGARETAEYLLFYNMRTVMSKQEMPRQTDVLFFPIETEMHLVKAIRQGNNREMGDIFRLLIYENFTYRKLSVSMASHLHELVKATVARALRETSINYGEVLAALEGTIRLEEIEEILQKNLTGIPKKALPRPGREEDESRLKQEKEAALREKMAECISNKYSDPDFSLYQLANYVEMTESRLYRLFKELFGMSFNEYLENERIKRACDLLGERVPVKEVAQRVGYGSDFSFRRAFKRVMGLPPSYYAEGRNET